MFKRLRTQPAAAIGRMIASLLLGWLVLVLSVASPDSVVSAQPRPTLMIATGPAIRDQVNAVLLGRILSEIGVRAQYLAVVGPDRVAALARGQVDVVLEVSSEQVAQDYAGFIARGEVLDLGFRQPMTADTRFKKLVSSGVRKRSAPSIKLIKNMTIPEASTIAMIEAVSAQGQSVEAAVETWVNANKPRWQKWMSASGNWMKP